MDTTTTIYGSIYVGTYQKYNNGSIAGKWLDLSDYENVNQFYVACHKLHKDESDPELMFQDWENIPDEFISESYISNKYWELMTLVEESYLDWSVWSAGLALGIEPEYIEENYQGMHDSDEDFTIEWCVSGGSVDDSARFPHNCIDWGQASRELMQGYNEHDGHYFIA